VTLCADATHVKRQIAVRTLLSYFKDLVGDPIFLRACVVYWGIPLFAFGCFALTQWELTGMWEWIGLTLTTAIGAYGLFLIYAGCLGSDRLFERATNHVSDGADVLGLVLGLAVAILAIPTTILLRALRWTGRH